MRHAYLIMAHEQPELLQKILMSLDCYDNDFIIHMDAKSKLSEEQFEPCIRKGRIFFTERVNVVWGDISMLRAELLLLKAAVSVGEHGYYHLISGRDFPLKPANRINEFFEQNSGKEFVHFCKDEFTCENYVKRHVLKRPFLHRYGRGSNVWYYFDRILLCAQSVFCKISKPKWSPEKFLVGSQFFSITETFAKYIIEQEKRIFEEYKYDLIPDEAVIQTLIYNSPFKDSLYIQERTDDIKANMRYIDWTGGANGSPATIAEADAYKAIKSGMLFARKVDLNSYPEAVKILEDNLKKNKNQ